MGSDPQGLTPRWTAPFRRVLRGNRNRNTTDNRNNNSGFRLARTSFAGAVGTMVPAGVHLTFRAVHDEHGRGRDGARYRGGACPWETHGLRQASPVISIAPLVNGVFGGPPGPV